MIFGTVHLDKFSLKWILSVLEINCICLDFFADFNLYILTVQLEIFVSIWILKDYAVKG